MIDLRPRVVFARLLALSAGLMCATAIGRADDLPIWMAVVKEKATIKSPAKDGKEIETSLFPGEILKIREGQPKGLWAEKLERNGRKTVGWVPKEDIATIDEGQKWLEKLIEKSPDRPDLLTAHAELYLFNGNVDEAIAESTRAIGIKPDYDDAYIIRGTAWENKGDLKKSMADLEERLKHRRTASALASRGRLLDALGKSEEALADLNEALRIDPTLDSALADRGNIWLQKGDYENAYADFTQAIKLSPLDDDHYSRRASACARVPDWDRATADLAQAIRLSPRELKHLMDRGRIWMQMRKFDEAAGDFTTVIDLSRDKSGTFEAYVRRSYAYYGAEKHAKAAADLENALETSKHSGSKTLESLAHHYLAGFQLSCTDKKLRNSASALEHAKKACELEEDASRLETLAAAYAANRDFSHARESQKKAIEQAKSQEEKDSLREQLRLYEAEKSP